jgi:glycosyltransferase involved in cell wall biosynthesis
MSLNISYKPQSSFELIRCGRDFDGGYLLTKKTIKETDTLVSFGILDDCSFEDEFLKIKPVKVLCYDHTVNNSYWKKRIFNDLGASIYNFNLKFFKNTLTRYFQFKKFFKIPTNFLEIETIKKGSLGSIISATKDFEAFGYSIAEALFVKTPVICTNVGGVKEFVNKKNALIIQPNNIQSIKKSLIYFFNNKKQINKKISYGHKMIKDKFNSDVMCKKFLKYFSYA